MLILHKQTGAVILHKQTRDGNAAADDETPDIDGNDGLTLMGTGWDVIAVIRDSYLHHI